MKMCHKEINNSENDYPQLRNTLVTFELLSVFTLMHIYIKLPKCKCTMLKIDELL